MFSLSLVRFPRLPSCCFKSICSCLLKHFGDGCFEGPCQGAPNISFSLVLCPLSFLIHIVIITVLGVKSNSPLFLDIWGLWVQLSLLVSGLPPCLGLLSRAWLMTGCGSDDSLVSWSAEPTWCGSELSFWGCSVPRGGVGDSGCGWSMFPWAHSPGGWMSTGLRLNIYSVAGRGREPPGHLMPLRGHDTWSPAFIKAPSQSTFPGPPAEFCDRLLYCFRIFPLHLVEESQERGVSTVTPQAAL